MGLAAQTWRAESGHETAFVRGKPLAGAIVWSQRSYGSEKTVVLCELIHSNKKVQGLALTNGDAGYRID